MRTLTEDARGFTVEAHKRRNLLNSAGSSSRPGTLGHRITQPRTRKPRATIAETVKGTIRTKRLNPPRYPLHVYLGYADRFPGVVECFRLRPDHVKTVSVSLGAGRGW